MNKLESSESRNLLGEIIETPRLILAPIDQKYREDIFKEFTSEIAFYMYPSPAKNINETEMFIKHSLAGLEAGNNLQMVILDRTNQEFQGCVGLHHLENNFPELGIWLKKAAHGQAYGREAIQAIVDWAEQNLDYDYLLYPVVDQNTPSRKIAESLGGQISKQYIAKTSNGQTHKILEYRIFPQSAISITPVEK